MSTLTQNETPALRWNRYLGLESGDERGKMLAKFFEAFSEPERWKLADPQYQLDLINRALAPLNINPDRTRVLSVREAIHIIESGEFRTKEFFGFGTWNSDTGGTPFHKKLTGFWGDELQENMDQRYFQSRIRTTFKISRRNDHLAFEVHAGFRQIIFDKIPEAIDGSLFRGMYYLIREAATLTAGLLVEAVLQRNQPFVEQLCRILRLYAVGNPPLEEFHIELPTGKLIVLGA